MAPIENKAGIIVSPFMRTHSFVFLEALKKFQAFDYPFTLPRGFKRTVGG
jgi:hypothetical protein